ncbi:substrate-binding domain-containing protein [Aquiluna sp.]|nr:substrate-binding domain-containing protein [Aquiluna sp.]MDA8927196.1 substrate-binding domain-containing protein [Aquiluna sp.]
MNSKSRSYLLVFLQFLLIAFGAIQAARDLGLRVPQDISVVGIDGHPLAEFYGLSTVDQKVMNQGAKAADTLIDNLESGDKKDLKNFEQLTIWPIDLVVRSSTARRTDS